MTTRILPEDVVIRPNLLKAIENTSPHSHIISFRPLALERLVGILLVQSSTGYIAGVLHDILQTYTCVVDRNNKKHLLYIELNHHLVSWRH